MSIPGCVVVDLPRVTNVVAATSEEANNDVDGAAEGVKGLDVSDVREEDDGANELLGSPSPIIEDADATTLASHSDHIEAVVIEFTDDESTDVIGDVDDENIEVLGRFG